MVYIPAYQQSIVTQTKDQLGNEYETTITKGFGGLNVATYNYVNQVARALIGLTTNTYQDSTVIMSKSVDEALADDAG